ncbi:MAG TPA: hypothetical protein VGC74_13650 [Stenotrophomonas sp.]
MRVHASRRLKQFVVVVVAGGWGLVAQAEPSNKWRIEVDGQAETAGVVQLAATPVGGTSMQVDVPVAKGLRENHVARLIRDALKKAIGKQYHVEIDDGEDVLVKRRLGKPDLDLQVTGNSVQGIRLKQHTE